MERIEWSALNRVVCLSRIAECCPLFAASESRVLHNPRI
jgi:hypothetical protein